MRRLTLILSLISFVLVFLSANDRANAQYASGSQQLFTETGYDFKGIPRYTMPKHSFIFTNNAKEDLRLVAVRTSCQCTKAYIPDKRVYKTGEKGEVVAQIDAVRFTGARHATVTITFERGGRQFEVALNVVGMVLENVRVEPDKLNFVVDEIKTPADPNVPKANRSQRASVLYPTNETVVRADCTNPYVDVKIGQAVRTNAGMQTPIVVSIKDNAPSGYVNAVVRLWSNGAYSSSPLSLNVQGSVRAQLSVSPSTLTFFTSEDGKKITKNIVVTATSEFLLKKIESESKAIECKLSPKSIRPARVCVIPITFDPSKLKAESTMTRIKIETTDGRSLYLAAQISSGNFQAKGLAQLDPEIEEFDENAEQEQQQEVASTTETTAPTSAPLVSDNGVDAVVSSAKTPAVAAPQAQAVAPAATRAVNAQPQPAPSPYERRQAAPAFGLPFAPFGGIFQ